MYFEFTLNHNISPDKLNSNLSYFQIIQYIQINNQSCFI